MDAMRCYASLPRRADVSTFLIPARPGGVIGISNLLQAADLLFFNIPSTKVAPHAMPTTTRWRKWYHTKLARQIATKDKLDELFKRIDKHDAAVMGKHYFLRGPQQYAKLAKCVVQETLGKPVMWPQAGISVTMDGIEIDIGAFVRKVGQEDAEEEDLGGCDQKNEIRVCARKRKI